PWSVSDAQTPRREPGHLRAKGTDSGRRSGMGFGQPAPALDLIEAGETRLGDLPPIVERVLGAPRRRRADDTIAAVEPVPGRHLGPSGKQGGLLRWRAADDILESGYPLAAGGPVFTAADGDLGRRSRAARGPQGDGAGRGGRQRGGGDGLGQQG